MKLQQYCAQLRIAATIADGGATIADYIARIKYFFEKWCHSDIVLWPRVYNFKLALCLYCDHLQLRGSTTQC